MKFYKKRYSLLNNGEDTHLIEKMKHFSPKKIGKVQGTLDWDGLMGLSYVRHH
jgi:hypothetical protein